LLIAIVNLHLLWTPESGVQHLVRLTFAGRNLNISVADGNCHFRIGGDFVLDCEGVSIKRHVGHTGEVTIPNTIERWDAGCLAGSERISTVTFKQDSRLLRIDDSAFALSSVSSICIPSSVEKLGANSFFNARVCGLPHSNLAAVFRFSKTLYFRSVHYCIPTSIKKFGDKYFSQCDSLCAVTFEARSRFLSIGKSAFALCQLLSEISMPSSVDKLYRQCFCGCDCLSTVTFDSGSGLACIKDYAFAFYTLLETVCFPASVGPVPISCFTMCLNVGHW
jgi:hypothetical protein